MGQAGKPLTVVSNTSPLTNLAAIDQFNLLRDLFGHIHISRAVESELFYGGQSWPGAQQIQQSGWIEIRNVSDRHIVDALRLEFDSGEAETITLALQLEADLVLLDELAGRRAARHFGLEVMGVVGMLVRAKKVGLIGEIRPLVNALREQAGFYLSPAVVAHALALTGEG